MGVRFIYAACLHSREITAHICNLWQKIVLGVTQKAERGLYVQGNRNGDVTQHSKLSLNRNLCSVIISSGLSESKDKSVIRSHIISSGSLSF